MTTDQHRFSQMVELNPVTEKIIGCAYKVGNTLGSGFFEKVYENALAYELRKSGLKVVQQHAVKVWYDGILVGDYVADLLVEGYCVLVDIKTCNKIYLCTICVDLWFHF